MTNHEYIPTENFELVTFLEAVKHLRLYEGMDGEGEPILSVPEDMELVAEYLAAAQGAAADYIDRAIVPEQLAITLGAYEKRVCFGDWRPGTVASVKAMIDGVETTLPPTAYYIYGPTLMTRELVFKEAFVSDDITVTIDFTVPIVIKQAVLLMLSDFYQYREARSVANNNSALNLLRPYRKY